MLGRKKQLLSISAAAALPRHPKADRAAPGVLYTYIDTHARSGVGIAVHTRLQTPFRALNSRSLMLRMYALWGVWFKFPPGLYTTTSVRVPVGGLSRRSGSVSPPDGGLGGSTTSNQSPSLGTTPAAQGCAAQGLSGPVRAGGRRRGGRLAATARCRRRAGAASSSGVSSPASVASVDMRAPLRRLSCRAARGCLSSLTCETLGCAV